jgi:ribonuclease D
MRGVTRGFAEGATGQSLLAVIAETAAMPDCDLPEARNQRDGPRPSPALVALLKVLLAEKADSHDVAPKLLASSEDIDRLATEDEPDIPALHGWRRGVFGEDALALKQGRIALGVNGRRIKLIRS